MKKSLVAVTTAATLALTLTACSGSGDAAKELARTWLDGDSSVQCLEQPAPWEVWELGGSTLVESSDGSEVWSVELSGVRKGMPVDDGFVLVEIRDDGESCVKWTQP